MPLSLPNEATSCFGHGKDIENDDEGEVAPLPHICWRGFAQLVDVVIDERASNERRRPSDARFLDREALEEGYLRSTGRFRRHNVVHDEGGEQCCDEPEHHRHRKPPTRPSHPRHPTSVAECLGHDFPQDDPLLSSVELVLSATPLRYSPRTSIR